MSDSLADWLAVREAADVAARSAALTAQLARALPAERPLRAIDLAAGTGSNIRYLTSRLPQPIEWLAVDRDPELLARVPSGVRTQTSELAPLDAGLFAGRHLVTASALLDLVSRPWMEQLVARCSASRASVLFALTYDGRSTCQPREPEDEAIRELFNAHQRSNDKGFGAAAGPDAADFMADSLLAVGYEVAFETSDWSLGPEDAEVQRGLIAGWADAAGEKAPPLSDWIASWRERRLAHVDRGNSRIVVGHADIAGWFT